MSDLNTGLNHHAGCFNSTRNQDWMLSQCVLCACVYRRTSWVRNERMSALSSLLWQRFVASGAMGIKIYIGYDTFVGRPSNDALFTDLYNSLDQLCSVFNWTPRWTVMSMTTATSPHFDRRNCLPYRLVNRKRFQLIRKLFWHKWCECKMVQPSMRLERRNTRSRRCRGANNLCVSGARASFIWLIIVSNAVERCWILWIPINMHVAPRATAANNIININLIAAARSLFIQETVHRYRVVVGFGVVPGSHSLGLSYSIWQY